MSLEIEKHLIKINDLEKQIKNEMEAFNSIRGEIVELVGEDGRKHKFLTAENEKRLVNLKKVARRIAENSRSAFLDLKNIWSVLRQKHPEIGVYDETRIKPATSIKLYYPDTEILSEKQIEFIKLHLSGGGDIPKK